jgi:hypothetical protein
LKEHGRVLATTDTTFSLIGAGVNPSGPHKFRKMNSTAARALARDRARQCLSEHARRTAAYTLGCMARKRPAPPACTAASERSGEDKREQHPQERFGQLAVERHVKDDGRALILYTHAEREQA